jgi:hypothetical protein
VPHKNGIADPCKLVTTAEVTRELHQPITTAAERRENLPAGIRDCAWVMKLGAKASTALRITVIRPSKATDPSKRKQTPRDLLQTDLETPGARPITHLGDAAATIGDSVEFIKGDTLVLLRYVASKGPVTPLDVQHGQALVNLASKAVKRL